MVPNASGATTLPDLVSLRKALAADPEIPSLSGTIRRILALDPEAELSAHDLARIILEDMGLTSRLLQVVNSFYYSRVGKEVTTVTHAVILLGFKTIREVALGMAVLTLLSEGGNKALARLLAQTFFAAHLARRLAGSSDSQEGEEVFLSALFHPLGRILMAIHNERSYEAITRAEARGDPQETQRIREFWAGLSRDIAHSWNMPSAISRGMEGRDMGASTASTGGRELVRLATVFSRSVIADRKSSGGGMDLDTMEQRLGIPYEDILGHARLALRETSSLTPIFHNLLSGVQMDQAGTEPSSSESSRAEEEFQEARVKAVRDSELFMGLFTQLSESLVTGELSLNQIYLLAVEALYRGVGLDGVLFLLLDRDRSTMTVRYGIGDTMEDLGTAMRLPFPTGISSIESAFANGEEMVDKAECLSGCCPEGTIKADRNLCISPLLIQGKAIGCFLLERNPGKGSFKPEELQRIQAIRHLVILATERRRRNP